MRRGKHSIFTFLIGLSLLIPQLSFAQQTSPKQNIEYNQGTSAGKDGNFVEARSRMMNALKYDIEKNWDDTFSRIGLTVAHDVIKNRLSKDVGVKLFEAIELLPYEGLTKEMSDFFLKTSFEKANQAIAWDKNYAIAYFTLGYIYGLREDIDSAIDANVKAIAIDPTFAAAHSTLVALYRVKGKEDLVKKHLDKTIELVNQDKKVPSYVMERLKRFGVKQKEDREFKNVEDHVLSTKGGTPVKEKSPSPKKIEDDNQKTILSIESLIESLKDNDPTTRWETARKLGETKDSRAIAPLIAALKDEHPYVRRRASEALGNFSDYKAVEPLMLMLGDKDSFVEKYAAESLSKITGQSFGSDAKKWQAWWEKNKK